MMQPLEFPVAAKKSSQKLFEVYCLHKKSLCLTFLL